jgi:hypothetical protein
MQPCRTRSNCSNKGESGGPEGALARPLNLVNLWLTNLLTLG